MWTLLFFLDDVLLLLKTLYFGQKYYIENALLCKNIET
jgi:hypothetical protein